MDFVGRFNFPNPELMGAPATESYHQFMKTRMDLPVAVRDARMSGEAVLREPGDATALLCDGAGYLLVRAPSKVEDWTNEKEVAAHYYDEARVLLQQLLPDATIPPLSSHTYRNEDIGEHYWVDGIQYGPCATAVHNDYADFVSDDGGTVTRKFSEVIGLPADRRVIGINIWRSVSPQPLERMPLAVCDRTSIDRADLEYALNPNAQPSAFNAHYCKPNTDQRWNYFSNMTVTDALVFTTYDSHPADGEVFCPTLHTAVSIPGSEGLQPRQSVEVRFFANLPLPR